MTVWEVLGIEPTKDIKIIKKAYAKNLKSIDSDNEIETFQCLKEAYDACIEFAKSNSSKNNELNTEFNNKNINFEYAEKSPKEKFEYINDKHNNFEKDKIFSTNNEKHYYSEQILYELHEHASIIYNFDNLDFWKKTTKKFTLVCDIESLKNIQEGVFSFICNDYYLLSNRVIDYLLITFGIDKNKFITTTKVSKKAKFYILNPINITIGFLQDFKGEDLHKYLKCKINAYQYYYENNIELAYNEIIKCKQEVLDDDILKLELLLIFNKVNSLNNNLNEKKIKNKLEELLESIKDRVTVSSSIEFKYIVLCVCNYLKIPIWFDLDFIDSLYQQDKEKEILKAYYFKEDFDSVINFYEKNNEIFNKINDMELTMYIKNSFNYKMKFYKKNYKKLNAIKNNWIMYFLMKRKIKIISLFLLIVILPYFVVEEIYIKKQYIYNISNSQEDILKNYANDEYDKKKETSIFYKPLNDIKKEKDVLLNQYTIMNKKDYKFTVPKKNQTYNDWDKGYFINTDVGGETVTVELRKYQIESIINSGNVKEINDYYHRGITEANGNIYFTGRIEKTADRFSEEAIKEYNLGKYYLQATGSNKKIIKENLMNSAVKRFIFFLIILVFWSIVFKRRYLSENSRN